MTLQSAEARRPQPGSVSGGGAASLLLLLLHHLLLLHRRMGPRGGIRAGAPPTHRTVAEGMQPCQPLYKVTSSLQQNAAAMVGSGRLVLRVNGLTTLAVWSAEAEVAPPPLQCACISSKAQISLRRQRQLSQSSLMDHILSQLTPFSLRSTPPDCVLEAPGWWRA